MKYRHIVIVRNKYFVESYYLLFMTYWESFDLFLYHLGTFSKVLFGNILLQCTWILNAVVGNVVSFL